MPVDKRATQVRQMFSAITPRYDLLNHLLSLNVDRYWRWRVPRIVPADGRGPILDSCSGTGDMALAYHGQSSPAVPIVGADFCRDMLLVAERKARQCPGSRRLRFVEADAQHLPFASDSFQVVCVAFGLRNVCDTIRGLEEMVRVTRPGGKVAVLEFSMPRCRWLRALYAAYFRYILPFIGQALAPNRQGAYNYLPASVLEFPEGEAMLELMRRVGLDAAQWHSLTLGIASLYVGTKKKVLTG